MAATTCAPSPTAAATRLIEAPVVGAARNHHGTGVHCLVIADAQLILGTTPIGAIGQTIDLVGEHHFDAEFLRLIVSARHQRHARDAGGKAEIVLDARGSARLALEGAAIEHDDRQSRGRRVCGSRQPRRPAARTTAPPPKVTNAQSETLTL